MALVERRLKDEEGAGNKAYQERYFELVSLGAAGEYGAFLVYYESELRASVKGYISLEVLLGAVFLCPRLLDLN